MYITTLDNRFMSPELKQLQRKVQREFYKHRKSEKWRRLKRKFKTLKKKTLRKFYSNFASELKDTNPKMVPDGQKDWCCEPN